MKDLSAIHARLRERLAFGWVIYSEHWQSHFVAVFYVVKGIQRDGIIYHGTNDTFTMPGRCRAKTVQKTLFEVVKWAN